MSRKERGKTFSAEAGTAQEKEIKFMRGDEEGCANLADDPRIALIASCVVMQQAAGFQDKKGNAVVDLRQIDCPECNAPGFNTGWGCWLFQCGAEMVTGDDAHIRLHDGSGPFTVPSGKGRG